MCRPFPRPVPANTQMRPIQPLRPSPPRPASSPLGRLVALNLLQQMTNAPRKLERGSVECAGALRLTLHIRRVGKAPMNPLRSAGKDGTHLPNAVADRNDVVKQVVPERIHRL